MKAKNFKQWILSKIFNFIDNAETLREKILYIGISLGIFIVLPCVIIYYIYKQAVEFYDDLYYNTGNTISAYQYTPSDATLKNQESEFIKMITPQLFLVKGFNLKNDTFIDKEILCQAQNIETPINFIMDFSQNVDYMPIKLEHMIQISYEKSKEFLGKNPRLKIRLLSGYDKNYNMTAIPNECQIFFYKNNAWFEYSQTLLENGLAYRAGLGQYINSTRVDPNMSVKTTTNEIIHENAKAYKRGYGKNFREKPRNYLQFEKYTFLYYFEMAKKYHQNMSKSFYSLDEESSGNIHLK